MLHVSHDSCQLQGMSSSVRLAIAVEFRWLYFLNVSLQPFTMLIGYFQFVTTYHASSKLLPLKYFISYSYIIFGFLLDLCKSMKGIVFKSRDV